MGAAHRRRRAVYCIYSYVGGADGGCIADKGRFAVGSGNLNLPLAAAAARAPLYAAAGRLVREQKIPMLREGRRRLKRKKCYSDVLHFKHGEKCRRQLAGLERMGAANPGIPCVLVGIFFAGAERQPGRGLQTLKEEIERLNERASGFAAVVRLGSGEPRERKARARWRR